MIPLESCIINIYAWCSAKRLQLNTDKTEVKVKLDLYSASS